MARVPRGRNLLFNDNELYEALNEVAQVLEFNRKKHSGRPAPWKKKTALYHILKSNNHTREFLLRYYDEDQKDPETGKSHLAHAVARLIMALALDRRTRNG